MFGVTRVGPRSIHKVKHLLDMDCSGMCVQCAMIVLGDERLRRKLESADSIRKRIEAQLQSALDEISLQTIPHFESSGGKIVGIVTGYSIIGTGVLTDFFSSVTDLFGVESNAYLEKIRKGEKSAILIAKKQALEMGADLISGFTISVAEATSGHGMLMISCSGTAVRTKETDSPIFAEMKKFKEATLLENLFVGSE